MELRRSVSVERPTKPDPNRKCEGEGVRVVGGRLGSRVLVSPPRGVRPTSDRVRESLFMRLGDLAGLRVLDLYAGTGSLGIEALSRGAKEVLFVDRAGAALAALRRNLVALDLESSSKVMRADASAAIRRLAKAGRCFDRVFLDPPYDSDELGRALLALDLARILEVGALVVAESPKRHPFPAVEGLSMSIVDQRAMGDTLITRLAIEPDDTARKVAAADAEREMPGE